MSEHRIAGTGVWGMSGYQWTVVFAAWLGWGFDVFDGLLFNFIAPNCIPTLLGIPIGSAEASRVTLWWTGVLTSLLLLGWALGGILFGRIADRLGRTRTLMLTMLLYSLGTALCALAPNVWVLAMFRFVASLGIGGEWAAGAALIAESFPEKSRAKAAGIMQASGGIGFFLATALYLVIGPYGWRWVFALGVLPAIVAFYVRYSLEEPARWTKAKQMGNPFPALFARDMRRDILVGTGLAVVATFGYQGAVQWVPSWIAAMLHAQGTRAVIPQVSLITTTLTTGGIIGCLCMPFIAERWGRKGALFIYFLGALFSVPTTFLFAKEFNHAVLASPVMGFFAAGVTTAFAIYFPELFPTKIRATAQGFCFNFARFFSAAGPLLAGVLTAKHGSFAPAIATIGLIYILGVIILIFARETRGQPLPE